MRFSERGTDREARRDQEILSDRRGLQELLELLRYVTRAHPYKGRTGHGAEIAFRQREVLVPREKIVAVVQDAAPAKTVPDSIPPSSISQRLHGPTMRA